MRQETAQVSLGRKVLSWIVSVAMVMLLVPSLAAIVPQRAWAAGGWSGSGSQADPYIISDAAGLQQLATDVNGGNAYANSYFKLGADIDLSGISNWTPIGYNTGNTTSAAKAFKGTFDGDGHAIENMTITGAGDNTSWVTFALFGAAQGTFKNFTVGGTIAFAAAPASSSQIYTSGVVGQATGAITFENVGSEVNITIPDFYYTGGILARASGVDTTFVGCYNKGNIYVGTPTGSNGNVGGIVGAGGTTGSSFKACYNAGDITLEQSYTAGRTRSIAGIAGSWLQKSAFVSCFNYGKLTYKYTSKITQHYGAMVGYTTAYFYAADGLSDNYYLSDNMFWDNGEAAELLADRAAGGGTFEATTAVDAATLKSAATIAALNNAEYETGKGYYQPGPDYPLLYWEAAGNPTITSQPEGYDVEVGGTAAPLAVVAALPEAGNTGSDGTLSYQWYAYAHGADASTATEVSGATSASLTPDVSQVGATDYYCVVTNSFTVEGESMTATATSEAATVNVQDALPASTPVVAVTLAETADQADTVNAQVAVSGLEQTDGKVSYKMEQTAEGATFDAVGGEADVTAGAASFEIPVNTYTLGANSVKVTVTNTYQLTKTASADDTKSITISGKTIGTADELADFAVQVNAGDSFADRTVTLTEDIDMSALSAGKAFVPIGNNTTKFAGEIAGAGHKITNLAISGETYAALVGYGDGAKIHDLEVDGTVSGTDFAAGIVGYANNVTATNVANHAAITQTAGSNYSAGAGGIFGYATTGSKVLQSYNDGAIEGKSRVGGVVGYGNAVTVTDCYNLGTVTNTGAVDNYSNGTAGIVGNTSSTAYGDSPVVIANAYNAGTIVPPSGATRSYGAIAYSQAASDSATYPTCSNVFYLEGSSDISIGRNLSGSYDATETYAATVKPLTTATLPAAFTTLGTNWQQAPTNYHDGYPALAWEDVPAAALVTFTLTAPVENLHLSMTVGDKTVQPALQENGTYTALLPDGTYSFTAEAFGYATQSGEFIVAGDPVSITIPAFVESAKQAVTFTVTNGEGAAIDNPTIVVKNSEGTVMEPVEGAYSLPDGTYSYTVSAKGYVAKSGTVTVAGAAVSETVVLEQLPAEWDGELISEPAALEGVYQIGHASELAWLAQEVNAGSLEAPVNAVLTADINLNNKTWTPIGTEAKPFAGTFDGQGFNVGGLAMVAVNNSDYVGLFGYVGGSTASTIKNMCVSGKIDAAQKTARIGGIVAGMKNTTVENCGSSVDIVNVRDSMQGAGGIVGVIASGATSTVKASKFDGELAAYADYNGSNVGGIVGKNEATGTVIDSCYNVGTVGSHYKIGGIIGEASNSVTVSNSYAAVLFGDVQKRNSGQFAGTTSSNVSYTNCYYAVPEGSTVASATSGTDPAGITKLDSVADLAGANLGDKFVSKSWVNDGIPVLTWEKTLNAAKVTFTAANMPEGVVITLAKGEDDPIVAQEADGGYSAFVVETAQGAYTYSAEAFGYVTQTGTVEVGAEDVTVELAAFEEAAKQTVTFNVASAEAGTELENLQVVITNSLGSVVQANEDGTYSLPAGNYTYKVTARGHLPNSGTLNVADAAVTKDVTLEVVPAWDGEMTIEPELVDGVFQVSNAQELAFVAALVNEAGGAADINVKLTDDIDLNNKDWTPIGKNQTNYYRGTFDGDGHAVNGLYIPDTYTGAAAGLFGYAGYSSVPATIKNLTVAGSVSAASGASDKHVAGLVGRAVGVTLENCGNRADVTYTHSGSTAYVAGIVAYIDGSGNPSVTGCFNDAAVTAPGATAPSNMGVAGIVGTNRKSNLAITDCYNTGTITAPKWAGGLVGYSYYGYTATNCYATGSVMCSELPGILGGRDYSNPVTFTNCYYTVPEGSTCTVPFNGRDTIPSGVTKADTAADITAAGLGESFKADRKFVATPILAWQTLSDKLALDAEGLALEAINIDAEGNVTVEGTYDGYTFTLAPEDVTATFYTDEACTTVAADPAAADKLYVKLAATEDGDFSGESAALAVNHAPALASGVEGTVDAKQFAGLDWDIDLTDIFTDAEGDALTYTVSVNDEAPEAIEGAAYSYKLGETGATLVFKANDGKAASVDAYTVTLSVRDVVKATVDYTSQMTGGFLHAPQFGAQVPNNEAENFGYADTVEGVSALDVLVAAHELTFGDGFTAASADEYLVMGGRDNQTIMKMFGVDYDSSAFYAPSWSGMFMVNHAWPNDGTYTDMGNWVEYTGTTVATHEVSDGDLVEFFFQEGSYLDDRYAWFLDANGTYTRSIDAIATEQIGLTLKGNTMPDPLQRTSTEMEFVNYAGAQDVDGAQIYTVDPATGALTEIAGAVTDEGDVTLSFDTPGEYYITAYEEEAFMYPLAMSLTKVTVKSLEDAKADLVAAIAAAEEAIASVDAFSADGTDVTTDKTWTTPEMKQSLETAIAQAEAVNDASTLSEVAAARDGLAAATKAFNDSIQNGSRPLASAEQIAAAETQVYNAKRALDGVMKSEDGSDVAEGEKWAPADKIDALLDAIAAVEDALAMDSLAADILQDATNALAEATYSYKAAVKSEALSTYKKLEGTAYVSLSYHGAYAVSDKDATTVMAYVPVDLAEASAIDLDEYGFGAFKHAPAQAGADYKYEASLLQIAIYLHEHYKAGDVNDVLAGYDSDPTGQYGVAHTFGVSKFWGQETYNLTYTQNGNQVSTLDQVLPSDGDVFNFAIYAGDLYDQNWTLNPNAGDLFFYASKDSDYTSIAKSYETDTDAATTVNVRRVSSVWADQGDGNWVQTTAAVGVEGLTVNYGTEYGTPLGTAETDANGDATLTFAEAGDYVLWVDGIVGAGVDYAVTPAAYAAMTVVAVPVSDEDFEALSNAIDDAEALATSTIVSADGADVATTQKWATQEAVDALNAQIEAAKQAFNADNATAGSFQRAKAALDEAVAAFNDAVKDGTSPAANEAAVKQLQRDIRNAERAVDSYASSADGTDVPSDEMWANDEAIEAVADAILAAYAALYDEAPQASAVEAAAQALSDAMSNLKSTAKPGSKATDAAIAELAEAIAEAEQADVADADEATKQALAEAIAAAKAAAADPNAQAADIENAAKALEDALQAAEDSDEDAKEAAADKAAADEVAAMIDKLPSADKATAADKKAADAAKAAFDELTDEQKALVPAAAIDKMNAVKKAADKAAAEASGGSGKTEDPNAPIGGVKKGSSYSAGSGASAGTYAITTPATKGKNGEVYYQRPKGYKSIKKVVVPDTIKIKGGTYTVIGVEKRAFNNAKKLTSVSFGKNVKTIRQYAFKNAKNVTKVTGGANIVTIEKNAFKGLAKVKKLPKFKNLETIGAYAFKGCKKLTSFKLGTKVKTIGKSAFYGCAALKSFTVTKNVKSIGQYAFKGCKKLKKITVKSKKLTSKKSVSKCLKSSKVKTVKLKSLGSKKSKVKKAFKKYAGMKALKF